jgi:hypothetical protein
LPKSLSYHLKRTLTLLTALLLIPLAALPAADPSIRLADNGTGRHATVLEAAETATAAGRFAAGELAHFLQKITGVAVPIVKEGEHAGPGIYVGHTRRAAKAGWISRRTRNCLPSDADI